MLENQLYIFQCKHESRVFSVFLMPSRECFFVSLCFVCFCFCLLFFHFLRSKNKQSKHYRPLGTKTRTTVRDLIYDFYGFVQK